MLEGIPGSALLQGIFLAALLAALLGLGIFIIRRMRRNPKDKEKRRRMMINQQGRLGDATITEVSGSMIFYEYSVRGVLYTASQEVGELREQIPSELERLIGPVSLKYSTNNPANSIILCEGWSGLRAARPAKPLGTG